MRKASLILFLGFILSTAISAQNYINYPLEKGSVTYNMSMMGSNSTITLYFNNKGNTQCTDIQMEMFGMKIHNRNLVKGSMAYNLDMAQKTYTESVLSEDDVKKMGNFLSDENAMSMDGVTKIGEETVLGKNCQIYSMNKDGADIKLWNWKGLMLKMETSAQGMTISMVATAISESAPDQSFFEIPSDFTKN
jgi:hypothetical protein